MAGAFELDPNTAAQMCSNGLGMSRNGLGFGGT